MKVIVANLIKMILYLCSDFYSPPQKKPNNPWLVTFVFLVLVRSTSSTSSHFYDWINFYRIHQVCFVILWGGVRSHLGKSVADLTVQSARALFAGNAK